VDRANQPSPVLFVLPNRLGKSVSETRWEPILRATPCLERLIPTGGKRHSFKVAQQQLGGSTVAFVGSNSPANLASRPVRVLVLDEVDKFAEASDKEADAVSLAEQRTSFAHYQHWAASTPTMVTGRIWQAFMNADMRRYECRVRIA
jgi:phage terminase large subunit GpA-like protein